MSPPVGSPGTRGRSSSRCLALAVVLVAACSSTGGGGSVDDGSPAPTSTASAPPAPEEYVSDEYLSGLTAGIFLPGAAPTGPLVVMVPGGAWRTADPAGLSGLATFLADAGMMVVTIEIRAERDQVVFPTPVEDILCAIGFGVARAELEGVDLGPVIVLGHSSGAHLAAVAALTSETAGPGCSHTVVRPDALVGLAGTYDVTQVPGAARALFGVSLDEDPERWERGNPLALAALRPELPVLLVHGGSDELVPVSFSRAFARALEAGGHDTTVTVVPGADHHQIYTAAATGEIIVDWIAALDG